MTYTVYMKNDNNYRIELFNDENQSLGKCRGKGNYIVRRADGKHYRVKSMVEEYKNYKSLGYKVEGIC